MRSRPGLLGVVAAALALVVVTACSSAGPAPGPAPTTTASATVPAPLAVPPGHRTVLDATVRRGSQIYACTRGAWALLAPAAVLTAPATDVLHTAGPRWIATADGSSVAATPVATVPVAGAAPELLLRVTEHDGTGLLSGVDYVQRLDPRGGATPTGPCTEGERRAVDYTADYRFSAPGA